MLVMLGAVYENANETLLDWLPAVASTTMFLLSPEPVIGGVTSSSKVSLFQTTLVHGSPPSVTEMLEEIGPKKEPVT